MWSSQLGLSAQAIAGGGNNHPWDPSDLLRCIRYCEGRISTQELRERMTGRSPEWDRLLPEWDNLVSLLRDEMESSTNGKAPKTYQEMKRVIAGGVTCPTCAGTGRGTECPKCKGTGHRSGGKCRAPQCYDGYEFCGSCRGKGYTDHA